MSGAPRGIDDARRAVSADIRAAIKAATPEAVHPDDDFGPPADCGGGRQRVTVRIAGWDPDETRSNEALLRRAVAHLTAHGWKDIPETTDSEDRSALVFKVGLGEGRLYASNQALTFTGTTEGLGG